MVAKGFTLIELLIVMAVIAVLAGITIVGLDPVDRVNAANDAKVQKDVTALASAMETYAATNAGTYATSQAQLTTNGDIKIILTAPSGYSTYTFSGGAGAAATAYGTLKSKKYTNPGTTYWVWCSGSGRAGAKTSSSTCP